jgi:hypothetical protein
MVFEDTRNGSADCHVLTDEVAEKADASFVFDQDDDVGHGAAQRGMDRVPDPLPTIDAAARGNFGPAN